MWRPRNRTGWPKTLATECKREGEEHPCNAEELAMVMVGGGRSQTVRESELHKVLPCLAKSFAPLHERPTTAANSNAQSAFAFNNTKNDHHGTQRY